MSQRELGVKSVLIDETTLQDKIAEMASLLTEEYRGKNLLLVSVLKGAFVFMADLCRKIDLPCAIEFMCVSSYHNATETTGEVKILKDIGVDISEYDVLIVEDILDTGFTLSKIVELLKERNPKSLKICTLLDKPARRRVDITADYTIFTIPDEFVIGYGLDCAEIYRNLPYIGVYDMDFGK